MSDYRVETEVFGVTYDRYVLLQLHRAMTKEFGLQHIVEMPSHGPRDVRIHRRFGSKNEEPPKTRPEWEVPFLKYVRTGNYPGWMRLLGRWDMMFRKGVFKLPMNYLFYVLGRKM